MPNQMWSLDSNNFWGMPKEKFDAEVKKGLLSKLKQHVIFFRAHCKEILSEEELQQVDAFLQLVESKLR